MSNIIPPLLSNSPPPPPTHEEDEDDEFGDFTGSNDLSYDCDSPSLPLSPLYSPKKQFDLSIPNEKLDINSNSKTKNSSDPTSQDNNKDFQDRRKTSVNSDYFNQFKPYLDPEPILDHSVSKADELESNKDAVNSETSETKVLVNHTDLQDTQKTDINNVETSIISNNLVSESVELKNNVILEASKKDEIICNKIEDNINGQIKDKTLNNIKSIASDDLYITRDDSVEVEDDFGDFVDHEFQNVPQKSVLEDKDLMKEQEQNISDVPSENNFVFEDKDLELKIQQENLKSEAIENIHDDSAGPADSVPEYQCEFSKHNVHEFTTFKEDLKKKELSIGFEKTSEKTEEFSNESEGLPDVNKDEPVFSNSENFAESVEEDDFGDFEFHDTSEQLQSEDKLLDKNNTDIDEEFDDFADFTQADTAFGTTTANTSSQEKPPGPDDQDEFGDFASPTIVPDTNPLEHKFNEFSSSKAIETIWLSCEQAVRKTDEVVKEMFPVSGVDTEEYNRISVEKDDFVFNELKDITETNAIKFHWANSASQKLLLKALNIDERNILYGPSWNPSMPRFAANLSLAPLEPVKSEVLTPVPIQKTDAIPSNNSSQTTTSNTSVDIPVASFDWGKAGLTDPLDYSQSLLLDLEQLVATLDIPTLHQSSLSNNSSSPIHELDGWDTWLQSITMKDSQFENEDQSPRISVQTKSDLEEKSSPIDSREDDFSDFTSYKAPPALRSPSWHNVVLRETHISNSENSTINVNSTVDVLRDIEGWLQPTIVTPELPRKTIELEDDDEFDDFQTVTHNPIHISDDQLMKETPKLTVKPTTMLKSQISNATIPKKQVDEDLSEFVYFDAKQSSAELEKTTEISTMSLDSLRKSSKQEIFDDFSEFTSFDIKQNALTPVEITGTEHKQENLDDISSFTSLGTNKTIDTMIKPILTESLPNNTTHAGDDEFTDFHSSLPTQPQPQVLQPITTVLQPLQPQVIHTPVSTVVTSKISWPDPGVTEDDLKRFEVSYSRVQPRPSGSEKSIGSRNNSITENSVVALERKDSRSYIADRNTPVKKNTSLDKTKQTVAMRSSLEDDEWSDFVSVKTNSPVHRVANEKSRSSTPDLPLSVLNLSSIQPLKQPIPVITPQGIFQKKLSSNSDTNMLNMQTVVQNNCVLQPQPQNSFYHPSIISNQYASQAYSNLNGFYPSSSSNTNYPHQKPSDDDEWSDFVSHQSFSKQVSSGNMSSSGSSTSGAQPKTSWPSYSQPLNMSSWSASATPNIITNPGSFDMLRVGNDMLKNNKQQQIKKTQVPSSFSAPPKRSTIPSIALPDLDFIAPKSRTSSRK